MGKVKKLDVLFQSQVFQAGTPVSGCVVLHLNEPSNVKSIKVKLVGEARVNFTTTKPKKTYNDVEKYFEQVDVLYENDNSMSVESGEHSYPFVFTAPMHLPSSFEHKCGYIRYWCKATVSRSWTLTSDTCKKPFSIMGIVDLNKIPEAFTPGYVHDHKQFTMHDRLLCCIRGGLTARLRIARKAFVPGEVININAEVTNHSSLQVKRVECFITQNVIFRTSNAGSKFEKGSSKIGLLTQEGIECGKTQLWHSEPLTVPPVPPSGVPLCKIIQSDYLLCFVVHVESGKPMCLTLPIVIGTVPLQSAAPARPPPPSTLPRQPSAPPMEFAEASAPPSYEECVYMDSGVMAQADDEADCSGPRTYKPLYPIYGQFK